MQILLPTFHLFLALFLAPLLPIVVNRVKAFFAGRVGLPWLYLYYEIYKLLHKGAVYSKTTSWIFRASPVITLAALFMALLLMPINKYGSIIAFPGDLFVFVYFLGVARFFTVAAALDTGSSFEGMGASREMLFSTLIEPALLLSLVATARLSNSYSLASIAANYPNFTIAAPAILLLATALLLVYLAENARIPIDDPQTHLELTMIHEVMILDHSGPDFAILQYSSALKLWVLNILIINLIIPKIFYNNWLNILCSILGVFLLAAITGIIESIMARLRLIRVPQLLATASVFAVLALILTNSK